MVAALTGAKPFDPARRATLFDPLDGKKLKPTGKEKEQKAVKPKEPKTGEHQTSFLAEFLDAAEVEAQWRQQQKVMRDKLAKYKQGKESSYEPSST